MRRGIYSFSFYNVIVLYMTLSLAFYIYSVYNYSFMKLVLLLFLFPIEKTETKSWIIVDRGYISGTLSPEPTFLTINPWVACLLKLQDVNSSSQKEVVTAWGSMRGK